MDLTQYEENVMMEVLPRLKDCAQIKLILDADFSPDRDEHKDELNAYRKNSLLFSLIYPYCKLFFVGRLRGLNYLTDIDDLVKYLKAYLGEMQFASGWLSGVQKKYEKITIKKLTEKTK